MMCRASAIALLSLAAPGVKAITYEGYASDTVCTNGFINTVDGVNNSVFAPNHTVACMLLDYCITSGYTLLERQGAEYVSKYQLDAAGVTMMVTALEGLQDASVLNNVMFRIQGTVSTEPAGTGAHSGDPTAANFRAAATYMGKPLGVVFETTSVTALEPGPALPYPLQPTEAEAEDDSMAMTGLGIGVVAAVVAVALGATVYFEMIGRPSDNPDNFGPVLLGTNPDQHVMTF